MADEKTKKEETKSEERSINKNIMIAGRVIVLGSIVGTAALIGYKIGEARGSDSVISDLSAIPEIAQMMTEHGII